MRIKSRIRWLLLATGFIAAVVIAHRAGHDDAFRAGYQAGLRADEPDFRYVMRRTQTPNSPNSSSTTTEGLYDLKLPAQAEAYRRKVEVLQSSGADFFVTTATIESHVNPDPSPQNANSYR